MKDLAGTGKRTAARIAALVAVMSLAILLGGCQPYVGLFVHDSYPFAVSIIRPYTDIQNKLQLWNFGTVLPGQQRRIESLVRGHPEHLEFHNPQGRIVSQVWISQNQSSQVYNDSIDHVGALYVSAGPRSVTVTNGDDPQHLNYDRTVERVAVLIFLVPIATGFIVWLARHWRSRQKALKTMR